MLLVEVQNSPSFKVRHFNADVSAWRDKHVDVEVRLVVIDDDAIHF